jgi:hypothetical protein
MDIGGNRLQGPSELSRVWIQLTLLKAQELLICYMHVTMLALQVEKFTTVLHAISL